jgi:DeoR family transcriptional regulator of aga operon
MVRGTADCAHVLPAARTSGDPVVTPQQRLGRLLDLLTERESLSVEEAAEALDVSPATVRRDMARLAEQQLLVRTHGGAVSGNVAYDLPLRYRTARQAEQKRRIGAAAAAMVRPGMVVGLNGGTTTTEVARALAVRGDDAWSATVVTNALNIASELAVRPHLRVVVTGGVARERSYELIGPLADRVLDELSLDVMFLGADGLDARSGATAHHEVEAGTNRTMAARAQRVVAVVDSSKLGRAVFARICRADEIDTLITDTGAADEAVRPFQEQGLTVFRV